MDTNNIIIIALAAIVVLLVVIAGFLAMDFKNNNQANMVNSTNTSSLTVERIDNSTESSQSVSASNDDDPFSQYSEDVQAQANHYKSTHNHYSDDDNIVAREYLGDGNYRIYYGDGRNYVVSGK